jgi:predicted kinase
MRQQKPKIVFLVGMPAVGKSTYISECEWDTDPNTYIHSTDNIVEDIAARQGIRYNDFFAQAATRFYPEVIVPLLANMDRAKQQRKNIIVDMVNESKEARGRTLSLINLSDYQVQAVVFGHSKWASQDPEFLDKIKQAVDHRYYSTGKSVPFQVLDRMFSSYEMPDESEGFQDIIFIDPLNPRVR